ncbi:MAG: hypothetical protein COB49_03495 [Alphaproteobacteria bacterium]|nr:MAG: hypothetical protein COB49_03495 [Alphaproteobacteria bacterium]
MITGPKMRIAVILLVVPLLAACAGNRAVGVLKEGHNDLIVSRDFGICKGYGCRYYLKTGLNRDEWQQIVAVFAVPPENAAQERGLIKKAIGLFERLIGPKTGTDTDDAGAQLINFSTRDQMDCIDEAFNSSTYLFLLRKAGLIRFHTLGKTLRRGNYINRWPHNSATIHEIRNNNAHYVVDSWFHANGEEPEIVPASQWSDGWSPERK